MRRTRRQLRDALVTLILARGWDKVSVLDVCARADVGRSTFYLHFADKEELLLSGFEELHGALEPVRRAAPGQFGFVEALLVHANANVRLFRAVVGRRTGQQVLRQFRDVFQRLVEEDLKALGVDPGRRVTVARFVSGGFVELMTAWIDRPSTADPASLATTFRQMTEGVVRAMGGADAPPPSTR